MRENTLAKLAFANPTTAEQEAHEPGTVEIRVLDDFELVLAGGGDTVDNWP